VRALEGLPPDFLCSVSASGHFMRLSLMKAAHAVLSSAEYRKSGSPVLFSPCTLGRTWGTRPGVKALCGSSRVYFFYMPSGDLLGVRRRRQFHVQCIPQIVDVDCEIVLNAAGAVTRPGRVEVVDYPSLELSIS
jgi:hypothetical protein